MEEEKKDNEKKIRISLSTYLLILAILIIAIMGIYIFKSKSNYLNQVEMTENTYNDLAIENRELHDKIDELQETINSVANVLNTNLTDKTSTNTNSLENTTSSQ